MNVARVARSDYVHDVGRLQRGSGVAGKRFGGVGLLVAIVGVVGCVATANESHPFEVRLASFSQHMLRAADAANQGDAENTVSEFRLACEELHRADATAPEDDKMLVRTMATQCKLVLAEFAMGEMESAIVMLEDLAWMASRLGPLDGEPDVNLYWMRCAVNLTVLHRDKCSPACTPQHYGPLLNDVANRCGGSDIQPSGGYLLSQLWVEARSKGGPHRR